MIAEARLFGSLLWVGIQGVSFEGKLMTFIKVVALVAGAILGYLFGVGFFGFDVGTRGAGVFFGVVGAVPLFLLLAILQSLAPAIGKRLWFPFFLWLTLTAAITAGFLYGQGHLASIIGS